jgi:predicted anti-sigma-YlaC factor YlaD
MHLGTPWFGPKTGFGWGWTPITWQGWALSAVLLAVVFGLTFAGDWRGRGAVCLGLVAGYTLIVVLTGTKPGGRLFG